MSTTKARARGLTYQQSSCSTAWPELGWPAFKVLFYLISVWAAVWRLDGAMWLRRLCKPAMACTAKQCPPGSHVVTLPCPSGSLLLAEPCHGVTATRLLLYRAQSREPNPAGISRRRPAAAAPPSAGCSPPFAASQGACVHTGYPAGSGRTACLLPPRRPASAPPPPAPAGQKASAGSARWDAPDTQPYSSRGPGVREDA